MVSNRQADKEAQQHGGSRPVSELRRVIWVGGALDKYSGLVRQHVLPGQHYFQWFERKALCRFLQQCAGQPVLIIAHSYGASTAAAVIASGYRVDELVTIDPVSWRKPNGAMLRKHCRHWRNYLAGDRRLNFANLVARCGGWWQHWPKAHAHQHLELPADHALIVDAVLNSWRTGVTTHAAA